jgi:hypothetical protein
MRLERIWQLRRDPAKPMSVHQLRIPIYPPMHSNAKPPTDSDLKPPGVPI